MVTERDEPDERAPDPGERARKLLPYLLETITIADETGKAIFSSGEQVGRLGYEPGTVAAHATFDIVHPDDVSRVAEQFAELLANPDRVQSGEFRLRDADGNYQWVEAEARNMLDDPDVRGIVLTTRNVTTRVLAEEALRRSEERFRSLVQYSTDVIAVFGADWRVLYMSPAIRAVLGFTLEEMFAPGAAAATVHPDDMHRVETVVRKVTERPGQAFVVQFRAFHRDGRALDIEASMTNLLDNPSVRGFVVNARDVTERREFKNALTHQALHDPLSTLPNRTLLIDRIQQALFQRERARGRLIVLFLDIDRFKVVNDSLGHGRGDRLLVEVARRLKAIVRAGDTVARLGGDEFVILCPDFDPEAEPGDLAERILDAVAKPIELDSNEIVVTASIGMVVADPSHQRPDDLLRDADTAMYVAKEQGKDRYAVFDESLRARSVGRLTVESELRSGLENTEFELYFQPEFDLRTGAVDEIEALLRWHRGSGEVRTPTAFLDIAEETGLLLEIGLWTVEQAAAAAARWRGRRVWINLSPRQLGDPRLPTAVEAAIEQHHLSSGSLGVEITEHALVRDTEGAVHALERLKHLGVRIALDDFGTGYSSLAYLRSFPVDTVKIDRCFIAGLGREAWAEAIVTAVVAMAHALGLTVVAEGVETDAQLEHARRLGVDLAQGFLLESPAPADGLDRLLGHGSESAAAG